MQRSSNTTEKSLHVVCTVVSFECCGDCPSVQDVPSSLHGAAAMPLGDVSAALDLIEQRAQELLKEQGLPDLLHSAVVRKNAA